MKTASCLRAGRFFIDSGKAAPDNKRVWKSNKTGVVEVFFKRFMAVFALVFVLLAATSAPARAQLPGATIPHLTTGDFLRTVGGAKTPVVVQFDAHWCRYCRALQPALDKLREAKAETLSVYKVDADHEPDLMESYEVRTLPTLIVFYEGRIVGRSDGSIEEEELFEWIGAVEKDIEKQSRKG